MPVRLLLNQPDSKFLIFGRGRSGSTLLQDLLNNHPFIHCQDEILRHPTYSLKFKIKYYESTHQKPVYGFKLLTYQCTDVHKIKNINAFLRNLSSDGYKLIYLERENIVHQAFSCVNAFQSGTFHNRTSTVQGFSPVEVPVEKIHMWINILSRRKSIEQDALKDLDFLHVFYEKHLENPSQHQSTVDLVCSYLNLDSYPVKTDLKKLMPSNLEEKVANFDQIKESLANTPYYSQF